MLLLELFLESSAWLEKEGLLGGILSYFLNEDLEFLEYLLDRVSSVGCAALC